MMASKLRFFSCLPLWFLTIVIMKLEEVVAAYKNRKTGERKMSSVWKEVEDEGITKGKSEVARNLLMKNKMSEAEIAEVTDLSLEEVGRIKSQMKIC